MLWCNKLLFVVKNFEKTVEKRWSTEVGSPKFLVKFWNMGNFYRNVKVRNIWVTLKKFLKIFENLQKN